VKAEVMDEKLETLQQAALKVSDMLIKERTDAIQLLAENMEGVFFVPKPENLKDIQDKTSHLGVQHSKFGTISAKPQNYVISWRKLLIPGGAIPLNYMSSTLTAMTILGFLVAGAVYKFDEIDAKILGVIHLNKKLLPAKTADFYEQVFEQMPEINKALYMSRIVNLSGYGAISIDDDKIKITEMFVSIG